jgi:CubicO group peptidase (beta-lactamase class C family)
VVKRLLLFIVASSAAAQDFDRVVQTYVTDRNFMGSVLVARGNQVLFSKGYGFANLEWRIPNDAATRFRIASITKQFTSAAILLLEERGNLTLDDPVKKFLPDAPAAWDKITLRHLLTHTSGIPDVLDTSEFAAILSIATTPEELVGRFCVLPLDFAPGSQFSYSNSGYILLCDLIEKISGASYADFLRENIFAPLGMNDSGYDSNSVVIPHRASGYVSLAGGFENAAFIHMSIPQGAGGLYSTTGDLLKWNQALFGGKILKPESLEKMTTPFRENYALGLSVETAGGRKTIRHEGAINGFDTSLAYFPADQLTIAVLSNAEVDGLHAEELTNALAALIHGDKRPSGAVFSGALVRVGKGSLTLRLGDGMRVDVAVAASGDLAAAAIAARFRLADQVRIECVRTKPTYDSEAALHLHLALKNIELIHAASSREQSQEVAIPSWDSASNLLNIPASLTSVSAAARDSAMAELERVRKFSLERLEKRPNFVAEEIARRYRSEGVGEPWKLFDTIESAITVKDDGISRENIRRNGKPIKQPLEKLPGPKWGQSFGAELAIFDPACSTQFDFAGLQAFAGRELRAYRFSLPPDNCLYTHTVSRRGGRDIGKYIPAVAGQVLVNRARAEVLYLECATGGFPETFGIDRSVETESWDYVIIGGSTHLVPVAVTWRVHIDNGSAWLFKVEYRNHRHFEASSKLGFGPG